MSQPGADRHAQALADLEAGRPRRALAAWRASLLEEGTAVALHLAAAAAGLPRDPIAPVRRLALQLAQSLLAAEPGAAEVSLLGLLLRHWGDTCRQEGPGRALQHYERAWACGRDGGLDQRLAALYSRLGYGEGAWELAAPPAQPAAWPLLPCLAQACTPCQEPAPPADPEPGLAVLPGGSVWVQRHTNPWRLSHGVAVQDRRGAYVPDLCRAYPWPWPACPHREQLGRLALQQLRQAQAGLPAARRISGPVLAVAELSGERFFHWQLELLPRLGRAWNLALQRWPDLVLWHNGGDAPWVVEGLGRLGIPPERVLPALDHLQADTLLVPRFTAWFGAPAQASLAWLERFWATAAPAAPPPSAACWLGRPAARHRPVLQEDAWLAALAPLGIEGLHQGGLGEQLARVGAAPLLIAPHGAGMANLIAAAPGTPLLELVNPAYQPAYFRPLIERRGLRHQRLRGAATPLPLQEWLYEGPLVFPIDLRAGASEAGEALARLLP